jgi:hypothetical protein
VLIRILHDNEIRDLCRSRIVVRIVRYRRLRWVVHVARIGRQGMHIDIWGENLLELKNGNGDRMTLGLTFSLFRLSLPFNITLIMPIGSYFR